MLNRQSLFLALLLAFFNWKVSYQPTKGLKQSYVAFASDVRAGTSIEYAFVAGLLFVVIATCVHIFGGVVNDHYETLAQSLELGNVVAIKK